MVRWVYERWLPMWAKETLRKDNDRLRRQVRRLRRELERERAFSRGLRLGLRHRDLE